MKNKGITLVALVITIIIMLILAGVTLRLTLGDNGLIGKSQKAVDIYQIENEREVIEMSVMSHNLGNDAESEDVKLGKSLLDRNLENSSIWDIIVEKSENKEYGTGWNYIEKGTNIEGYGKAKNNWVVNYKTGEIINLEDDTYNNFTYKSTVKVEHPLFNLDSANVNLDKSSWGNNVTLYYYDDTIYDTKEKRLEAFYKQSNKNVSEFEGYDRQKSDSIQNYLDESTGAFNFNGNNYIEVYNEKGFDFTNGLTYEFYGKINGGTTSTYNDLFIGFFGTWSGKHGEMCQTRFGCLGSDLYYSFSSDNGLDSYGEWSNPGAPWNQHYQQNILNKEIFLTVTINQDDNGEITQNIYIDGKLKATGWVSKAYFDVLINKNKELKYLELGRCNMSYAHNFCYLQGICYSLRMYNRALSSEEVQANYSVTTDFHKYIIESKNKT